ncbi:MAG: VOC family protein [Calditrichaeota bacterium]|nr:MAG: VOC family protein [Calditrichota bacterium]
MNLKIKLSSVLVDDQEKAEKFYTEILGFKIKHDIPIGEYKWLTVVSHDDPDGTELLLEPNGMDFTQEYQKTIYEKGMPAMMLFVDDINEVYEELKKRGVKFTKEPTDVGMVIMAIFDDTCGNLIQMTQEKN